MTVKEYQWKSEIILIFNSTSQGSILTDPYHLSPCDSLHGRNHDKDTYVNMTPVSIFLVPHVVATATAGAIAKARTNKYQTRVISSASRSTSVFAVPSSNKDGGSEYRWKADVRSSLGLVVESVMVVGMVLQFCVAVSSKSI